MVIAGYRPRPGMEAALEALVARHWGVLRSEALVSGRPPCAMRAADGTVLEVFEWLCAESIERAHRSPAVQALWSEFAAVCDWVPVAALAECGQPFAEFEALGAGAAS
jgi:hypothetical protein